MPKTTPRLVLIALLLGCDERERLTFPSNQPGDDDQGPITVIDIPRDDTVLTEGDPFVLSGRSIDSSGVDTVYFDIVNGAFGFSPLTGEGADTVRFGLQISTIGRSGQTITVSAIAVDVLGNRGGPAIRRLSIE